MTYPIPPSSNADLFPNSLRFSPSRLMAYSNCHARGWYTYEAELEPNYVGPKGKALELGTIVHRYLQLWHGHKKHPTVAFHEEITEEFSELKQQRELSISALTVMARYVACYEKEDATDYTVEAAEHRMIVPYSTPNGVTVYLDGIIDLVAVDNLKRVGPWDHKTSARMVWRQDTVHFDPQLNQYLALLYLSDYMPEYAMINQINTGIRTPKTVANAPRDRLFSRIKITPSPVRIEAWLSHIGRTIDKILETEGPQKNLGQRCVDCPFRPICHTELDGHPTEEIVKNLYKPRGTPDYQIIVSLPGDN